MTISGFDSIKHARNFASTYGGKKDGYSTSIVPSGMGKNSIVTIIKTKEFYEDNLKSLDKYRIELAKIRSYNLNI